jgi:hypothetical protein
MKYFILIVCFVLKSYVNAQELYPTYQAASSLSKNVLNFKLSYRYFEELTSKRPKHWMSAQFLYGLTSKLTLLTEVGASNHHYQNFGNDLTFYFFNHHLTSYQAATFKLEGIRLYAKYRLISMDAYQKHFRVACFMEGAYSFVAHDEAEPILNTDNTGIGGGFITTYLNKKFSISFNTGTILPFAYKQNNQNYLFKSGRAFYVTSSIGYRLFPLSYKSYEDINVNLYFETMYKIHDEAIIKENGNQWNIYDIQKEDVFIYNSLKANEYIDGKFFIQLITNSYNRIELGVGFPLLSRSYNYFSPMYMLQYQHTFKPTRKKKYK